MKTCGECKKSKRLTSFYNDPRGGQGVSSWCKECRKAYIKRPTVRKRANKLRTKKRWENIEIYREQERAYYKKNPIYQLHRQAKARAKRLRIPFKLTLADIKIPEKCPLLGVPFIAGTKENYTYTYSLDRIVCSKGYVKGNVQVITKLANSMKNEASVEQLITFAQNILRLYKPK